MDFFSHFLAILGFLAFVTTYYFKRKRTTNNESKKTKAPQPPGALPFIGHLHLLRGQDPIARTLGTIADEFGPIFSLRLGNRHQLVVSSWEMVKQCFTTNDTIFATRPSMAVGKYLGYGYATFALAPYGPYWRNVRKIVTLELLTNHRLEKLEHVRASELNHCIRDLYSLCTKNEDLTGKVHINKWCDDLTFNITIRILAGAMSKSLVFGLLILWGLFSISAANDGFPRCNCDEEGFWSLESILECQKVSDFLIAVAYFSIPIELLYFISCSTFPFKWVIIEFIAFIVLCGMTHLLNGWTYGPHPFQLMLALTIFKLLTALVSFATAITLITLIPLLLKVKVREFLLIKKTWDLGREVGIKKQQKEAGWHVRMLTQEIRKSLDRHTILYTTLDKLSETLDLQNCAIWMPNEIKTEMNLTHELKVRNISTMYNLSIPISDPDVRQIKENDGVKILDPQSALAERSNGGTGEPGTVAAIRMPMLRVSDFNGGTPEMIQACYAILVLVLPSGQFRSWGIQEIEIVKVVADQVAVALSHAAVLEESQLVREKLVEQNRALQQAKQDAMMASQARNSFQMVMSNGLRRPMHSIMGLLSMMQDENLSSEQQILVDTMVKTSNVLSVLINDVMDTSPKDSGRFPFEMRSFRLHSMVKEAACLAKCLCVYRGYRFAIEVEKSLPDNIMGDERRVFQVILHMVGNLLNGGNGRGCLTLKVFSESGSQGRNDQRWGTWRPNLSDGYVYVKFEIGINNSGPQLESSGDQRNWTGGIEEGLSFSVCRKLVQMMQGNIWVVPNPVGFDQSMALVLRFQLRPSIVLGISETGDSSEHPNSNSLFRGLQILLADHDDVNLAVTRKLLEKLGCVVSAVSSGYECLSVLGPSASPFQIVLMDLHMPDLDGYEVTIRIRKFRSRNWPLVIALSASDNEDVWERCLQVGINGLVQKPVVVQGIADELRRVLLQANKVVV